MTMSEIGKLVSELQGGKTELYEQLYQFSLPLIQARLAKLGAKQDDIQDVSQEVLLRVYLKLHQLRNPICYVSWLNRVIFASYQKFLSKEKLYVQIAEGIEIAETRGYMLPENLEKMVQQDLLEHILDLLSPKLQEVVTMYYLEEMSEEEIANAIAIPKGTVKSRLHSARSKFKASMQTTLPYGNVYQRIYKELSC